MQKQTTKKLTKVQLIKAVQDTMGEGAPTQATIEAVFTALGLTVQAKVKEGFIVEVPGVTRVKPVRKDAQPAHEKMNYITKQLLQVPAKPAYTKVKTLPAKALRDAVA